MTSLLVLDDDKAYGEYIGAFCRKRLGLNVTVEESAQTAFDRILAGEIDLVLCDVRMPEMSGIEFTQIVTGLSNAPRVVGMTSFDEDANIIGMLRAGAIGMILKAGPEDHLVEALNEVCLSRGYISSVIAPRINRYLMPAAAPKDIRELTTQEREILFMVIQGFSNSEIAASLHISTGTVKKHLAGLFRAFGVDSRVRLVVAAMQTH